MLLGLTEVEMWGKNESAEHSLLLIQYCCEFKVIIQGDSKYMQLKIVPNNHTTYSCFNNMC